MEGTSERSAAIPQDGSESLPNQENTPLSGRLEPDAYGQPGLGTSLIGEGHR